MKKGIFVSVLLAAVFFTPFVLFAGGRQTASSSEGSSAAIPGDYSEPMELSIAVWGLADAMARQDAKNDAIFNGLLKQFNINIVPVDIKWTDYQEKTLLWAATGQLPDIFCYYPSVAQYKQWAEEGVVKRLPKDLSPWPEIQKTLADDSMVEFNIDGYYYVIPGRDYKSPEDQAINYNVLYRKDWAKEAGWDKPLANINDYIQMIKAVKAKHPGVSGLTMREPERISTMLLGTYPVGALGMYGGFFYVKEGDFWKPAFATEAFAQAMSSLRLLWTEGAIDRDAAINNKLEGELKFFSGQSFSYITNNIGRYSGNAQLWNSTSGGVKASDAVDYLELWPASDGNRYRAVGNFQGHKVSFSNSISDKKLIRALDLVEYMNKDDSCVLLRAGRENIDWRVENNMKVSLYKEGESFRDRYPVLGNSDFRALGTWASWLPVEGKLPYSGTDEDIYFSNRIVDYFNYVLETQKAPVINWKLQNKTTPAKEKVGTFMVSGDMWSVIMGSDNPMTMWKKVIKDYESRGLTDAINEMTAEAKKLGL